MGFQARTLSVAILAVLVFAAVSAPAFAQGGCCVEPDNGNGTATLPPNCPYLGTMQIVDGLVNATINIDAQINTYQNVVEQAGGALGGTRSTFDAILRMEMSGTGNLNFFNRTIFVPVACEFHWGPRTPGNAVQSFPGDVWSMTGQIVGDPDFDLIRVQAGSNLGLPGPGQTTLTRLGPAGSDFTVDSFFDINYQIEFSGAAGSVLQLQSGTTNDQKRFDVCPVTTPVRTTTWGRIKTLIGS